VAVLDSCAWGLAGITIDASKAAPATAQAAQQRFTAEEEVGMKNVPTRYHWGTPCLAGSDGWISMNPRVDIDSQFNLWPAT
jgi:hypothetical protein